VQGGEDQPEIAPGEDKGREEKQKQRMSGERPLDAVIDRRRISPYLSHPDSFRAAMQASSRFLVNQNKSKSNMRRFSRHTAL
jgi:hypothetical protein